MTRHYKEIERTYKTRIIAHINCSKCNKLIEPKESYYYMYFRNTDPDDKNYDNLDVCNDCFQIVMLNYYNYEEFDKVDIEKQIAKYD